MFFVCSSYPARHVLAIKPGGRGNITATHIVWRTMEGAPYVPSPIVEGDYLLTASNSGPLYCYEAATGKILWHEALRAGTMPRRSPPTAWSIFSMTTG